MKNNSTDLFSNNVIGKLNLKNRLAVAPMTRVSGNADGTAGPLMKDYYQAFAQGGFGLIITEGIYPDKLYSQGYKFQPGLTDEAQAQSWKPIVDAVHESGSLFIAQLMHAGALSQYNNYTGCNAGPSAVKPLGQEMTFYYGEGDYSTPKTMDKADISDVVNGFVNAAKLAKRAGFDGVEIHGANGYLLDQFITVHTNERTDEYGGSLVNRLRIYEEVITSIRKAVGDDFTVGIRFSQGKVNDFEYKWPAKNADAKYTFELTSNCGVDYIHTTEYIAKDAAFEKGLSLAELAKKHGSVPVIANGSIVNGSDAKHLIDSNQADVVAVGKMALANPDWPNIIRDQKELRAFSFEMFNPLADLKTANEFLAKQI
jgi:2,4-dienoyl-CoA reductase-like NADH-dependent reductase (Old Yellow Enzyme family)